jgi:hypothetical protein
LKETLSISVNEKVFLYHSNVLASHFGLNFV